LQKHPDLLTCPANLSSLSLQHFSLAKDSPEKAYLLLTSILSMIDKSNTQTNKEVFLIIDRIDDCLAAGSHEDGKRFLRSVKMLNDEFATLRIILTSQRRGEEMKAALSGKAEMSQVWIDTTGRQGDGMSVAEVGRHKYHSI